MKKKKNRSPAGALVLRQREEARQMARIRERRASEVEKVSSVEKNPITGLINEFPITPMVINLDMVIDPNMVETLDSVVESVESVESKDSAVPLSHCSQSTSGTSKLIETLWEGVVDSIQTAITNCRLSRGERGGYPKRPGKGRGGSLRVK